MSLSRRPYGCMAYYLLSTAIIYSCTAPTGTFCCLLRRFSRALQSTNLCFGAAPARLLLLGVWILELRESGWPDVWLAAAC
jgi:hypothetical protein